MKKNADGSVSLLYDMPEGLKDFWKIFFPKQQSTLQNVQGNHCGSWNFGLNYYVGDWKLRAYLEHYFKDHSQMFWQYGRWKDGHIGLEVSLPRNRWVSSVVWEGLNTTDQTGPILYDGIAGSFPDLQMSGRDNYYTNGEYLGWQNYGAYIGRTEYRKNETQLVLKDFKIRSITSDNKQDAPVEDLRHFGINSQEETVFDIVNCNGKTMTLESDYARLELRKF